MFEARREGPKALVSTTKFFKIRKNQLAEGALREIFQDIREQVLGTSQGEYHPQVEPLL
jgi:hypothetical protein